MFADTSDYVKAEYIYLKNFKLLLSVPLPGWLHCSTGNTVAVEKICMSWILLGNAFSYSLPQKCDFFRVFKIITALIKKRKKTKKHQPNQC